MVNLTEFSASSIPVIEIFQSISGEGITSGEVFTFVRVTGCNLRCAWCDTKYSHEPEGDNNQLLKPGQIADRVEVFQGKNVLCTGGEPLEENTMKRYLPLYLASLGYRVRIETNGACALYNEDELHLFSVAGLRPAYTLDVKCPSSGYAAYLIKENFSLLGCRDELKFVVADRNDLKYAVSMIERYMDVFQNNQVTINFSPVTDSLKPELLTDFLKDKNRFFENNRLKVRLSLQIHKYIWPPETRAV